MKRKITLFFLIIICFVLQTTGFQYVSLGGVVPNILLIVTSCFGFMRGKKEGMYVGFFSGILIDIFYGGGMLGLYALIYMVMGYLNGFFHRIFYPEDIKLPIVFVAVSDGVYCIISYVLLFMLRTRMEFVSYLRKIILPEIVYTILLTLIIYRIILGINNILEKDEKEKEAKFA